MLTYHSQKMSKIASERSLACRGCSLFIVGARLPLPARAAACRCDENKHGAVIAAPLQPRRALTREPHVPPSGGRDESRRASRVVALSTLAPSRVWHSGWPSAT